MTKFNKGVELDKQIYKEGDPTWGCKSGVLDIEEVKEFLKEIEDWCYKNNTLPLKDLHKFDCICGHSLLEHGKAMSDIDINKMTGKECSNPFCSCKEFRQDKSLSESNLKLATTDGGWVNVIKLMNFIKERAGGKLTK